MEHARVLEHPVSASRAGSVLAAGLSRYVCLTVPQSRHILYPKCKPRVRIAKLGTTYVAI